MGLDLLLQAVELGLLGAVVALELLPRVVVVAVALLRLLLCTANTGMHLVRLHAAYRQNTDHPPSSALWMLVILSLGCEQRRNMEYRKKCKQDRGGPLIVGEWLPQLLQQFG